MGEQKYTLNQGKDLRDSFCPSDEQKVTCIIFTEIFIGDEIFESGSVSRSVLSDSLRPHRLQPPKLLCAWDFPGNSTGVDCHFSPPGDLPDPRIEPSSPTLASQFFTTELSEKPKKYSRNI